jgi:hypothetical protein
MVVTTNVQLAQFIAQLNRRGIQISDPMALHIRISGDLRAYKATNLEGAESTLLIADYGTDGYKVFVEVDTVSVSREAEIVRDIMAVLPV